MEVPSSKSLETNGLPPFQLPTGKSYHVFISYATAQPDKQLAELLYTKLTERKYRCCLHETEFKPGRLIQDNIDKYMGRSLKTIVLLSQNFLDSFWCSVEMNEVVNLHMENKGFPPIILKLDGCNVPDPFKFYTYMSLHGGLEKKMTEIVDSINNLEQTHFEGSLVHISFVPLPCINYNMDICHSPCIWPHVCAKFILSQNTCCENCNKLHVLNKESLEKLRKCGFPVEKDMLYLMEIYREKCRQWLLDFPSTTICGPCSYYNGKGCFTEDDCCPFMHICKEWFIGACKKTHCPLSHNICNSQTKSLLEKFGLNTNHPDDIILCQYREKCPEYLELKSKYTQNSTLVKITSSFNNLRKYILFLLISVIYYNF